MLRRFLPWCAIAVAAAIAVPVLAAGPPSIDEGGIARQPAEVATPLATDVVTIYDGGAIDDSTITAAFAAAREAGGTAAIGRSASLGMKRILRGSTVVQQPPSGYSYPMGTTVLPNELIGRIMGRDVSAVLTNGTIVMSALTAGLRGAEAGDRIELVSTSGTIITFNIGAVVDDAITGGTELLMSPGAADRLGLTRLSRVVLWGFESRESLDDALVDNGLISTSIRVRRSWDPFDPDLTLGMARSKELLGEFAYRINGNGSLSVETGWYGANITSYDAGSSPYLLTLPSRCHEGIRVDLQAAMDEAIAEGVADAINYFHANTAGGCWVPRFTRQTQNSSIGFLSRHTWGMAVDTNTIGGCIGCAPPDFAVHPDGCELVQIFRKHGFAWGGNFLTPDGMHFEWVGEPRDQFEYPSRYCPNDTTGAPLTRAEVEATARATLFAEDGLIIGDHHGHGHEHGHEHGHDD